MNNPNVNVGADPRPIMRSIRMSSKVSGILELAPGDGYNNKFEYICLDYMDTLPQRTKELDKINKDIEKAKLELESISKKIEKGKMILHSINSLESCFDNVKNSLNSLLRA